MMREVIIDGVKLKRLPGSDYWVSGNGTIYKLVAMSLDKQGRYHMRKNSNKVTRTRESLKALYNKLK